MESKKIYDKMQGLFSGLIGGTLSLTVSAVIVKFIGLVYKIPIASLLGDEGMGYFNSAYTVFSFFYLLSTAGVPKAVMILISEAKARNNSAEEGRILRVALMVFSLIGLLLTGLLIVFAFPLATLIGNSKSSFTMIAIAPSVICVSLSGVLRGYLSANTRLVDVAVSQIVEGVGKLGLGLALAMIGIRMKLSLELLSALTVTGVTLGSLFGLIYLFVCSKSKIHKENTGQKLKKNKTSPLVKRIFAISLPITLSAAITSLTSLIDLGLIMRCLKGIGYSEASASALYGNYTTLAVPMLNLATALISPISVAFLPLFTRCSVSSDYEGHKRAERSAVELTSLLAAPIMIGLMFYSKEILSMLFHNSEISVGSGLLSLIAPAIFFSSLLLILNTVLEGVGKLRAPLISMGIGGIVKIIASYILITKTDMGIYGAPLGTVLSYAVGLVVSLIIYSLHFKRHFPIFEGSILPYLGAFVSVGASRLTFEAIRNRLPETPSLIIAIFIAALIYLGISVFLRLVEPKKINELAKYTKLS